MMMQQGTQMMQVQVPPGLGPGAVFVCNTSAGPMQVRVPAGLVPNAFGQYVMAIQVPVTTQLVAVMPQPVQVVAQQPIMMGTAVTPEQIQPQVTAPSPPAEPATKAEQQQPADKVKDRDNVDEEQLVLCCGIGCLNASLMFEDCCGCSGKTELLCLSSAFCCKLEGQDPYSCDCNGSKEDKNVICQIGLFCCAIACKYPTVCLKAQTQICCTVESAALPMDDEIKATCAVCGFACYPALGCCERQGVLNEKCNQRRAGGAPPAPTEMTR